MSLTLTYPALIPESELIDRLLGPDTTGAFVKVVSAEATPEGKTRVHCMPVAVQDLSRLTRDDFGYYWLREPAAPLPPPVH